MEELRKVLKNVEDEIKSTMDVLVETAIKESKNGKEALDKLEKLKLLGTQGSILTKILINRAIEELEDRVYSRLF